MTASSPPGRDTAADHLVRIVATAQADESVGSALRRLRSREFATLHYIYVIDDQGRLSGLVPFTRLMASDGGQPIGKVMDARPEAVTPDLDQEEVVAWARHRSILAPPVVDADGRLIGCIPPQALIEIGRREHAEDISRLAGIVHRRANGVAALEAPPWHRAINRLPWLVAGLAGSVVATVVVASFEARLSADIAIAYFIPAIVYLADAVGTQTEAVVVRGLSFFNAPHFSRLLSGELVTGLIIGLALGTLASLLVYFGFGDGRLALAVGLAIAIAGTLASVCGLLLPWFLSRIDLDPAFGSGPIATVIQDVLSLLTYFGVLYLIGPG